MPPEVLRSADAMVADGATDDPFHARITILLAQAPADVLRLAGPGGAGLRTLVPESGVDPEHFGRFGGTDDPEPASPADMAEWEGAYLGAVAYINELVVGLEPHLTKLGKRDIDGIPSFAMKEKFDRLAQELAWCDAPMWAANEVAHLPTDEWFLGSLVELAGRSAFTRAASLAMAILAGLDHNHIAQQVTMAP